MKKLILLLAVVFLVSCKGSQEENIIQTFIVASERVSCDGYIQNQQCLLIKLNASEESWSYFYEPIAGFDHEIGFEYVIRVNREFIPENQNIADTSLYEYTLLETVSREEKTSEGL